MSRKLLLAATLLAAPALLPRGASAQPVTGLYIGAGAGANFMQTQQDKFTRTGVVAPPSYGRSSFDTGVVGLGSIGWGFGNGVRVEIEGNYRNNRYTAPQGVPGNSFGGREEKYGGMVNALFDLDVGSPYVYPVHRRGRRLCLRSTRRISQTLGPINNTIDGNEGGFAYQAIAGLSFPVPWVVGLSLTAEYRYYALSGDRTYDTRGTGPGAASGTLKTRADFNHDLMLGLRYAFNVAPPPPPAVAAAPAPVAGSRTHLSGIL